MLAPNASFTKISIRDGDECDDDYDLMFLCVEIINKIINRKCVFVHCWGGHGRTNLIASILIGILFDLHHKRCFNIVQKLHDYRIQPLGVVVPSNGSQRDQVKRVLSMPFVKQYILMYQQMRLMNNLIGRNIITLADLSNIEDSNTSTDTPDQSTLPNLSIRSIRCGELEVIHPDPEVIHPDPEVIHPVIDAKIRSNLEPKRPKQSRKRKSFEHNKRIQTI